MNINILYNISIKNVTLGDDTKIFDSTNLYGCNIGNKCFIDQFVEIQKNVIIGDNTTIISNIIICEVVVIGRNCFICNVVVFVFCKKCFV